MINLDSISRSSSWELDQFESRILLNFISRSYEVLLDWFYASLSSKMSGATAGVALFILSFYFCWDYGDIGLLSDFRHARSSLGFYFIPHSRAGFLWNRLLDKICLSSAIVLRDADLFCRADVGGGERLCMRLSRGFCPLGWLWWLGMGKLRLSGWRDNLSRGLDVSLWLWVCMNNNRLWNVFYRLVIKS